MAEYNSDELIDYLNNPIKKGLWSISATIENEEETTTLLDKKNPIFKDYFQYQPLSYGFVQWFNDIVVLASDLNDNEKLLKNYGLTADSEKYNRFQGIRRYFYLRGRKFSKKKSETIKNTFKKEIEVIKEKFPKIVNVVSTDGLDFISIKPTFHFSFNLPQDTNQIKVITFSRETADNLKEVIETFFMDTPAKINFDVKKIYTPELLIFRPYFHLIFLLIQNKKITENRVITRELKLSLTEAFEGKPEGSIRSSGLAMEMILEEIYESCFREKAPSQALGNLFDMLNGKVNEIIKGVPQTSKDDPSEDIFKKINCIIMQETNPNILKTIETLRVLLHRSREMEKKLSQIEKSFQIKKEKRSLLFSESITENIKRTIELRNLSSHRTIEELTPFQAALALRGTFNLLSWWNFQNNSLTDWDKPIEEVVNSMVKYAESFQL
jgi:hypothetical protein